MKRKTFFSDMAGSLCTSVWGGGGGVQVMWHVHVQHSVFVLSGLPWHGSQRCARTLFLNSSRFLGYWLLDFLAQ